MKTKNLVMMAMLLGIGTVLHAVIPGFLSGMKFDLLLTMMFLGIILFPDVKSVAVLGLATGVISAATTSFPGGQLANFIDKPVTAFIFFGLYLLMKKTNKPLLSNSILTAIGTVCSGTVFLTVALVLTGLPVPFTVLFLTIVLPTAAVNAIAMFLIYPIIQTALKRTSFAY
ncbi:tryptophan transporter [Pseudalkalibacillus caeni]|uniref:Tryptophan transporter n=1 Tax=Exobacillus caeni TaxID=2574798 RepID=A0A5R9F8W7_9BACL|nr:tryptophan transporter [Pseudalkalibacillus caeni]TLS38058.1 tryptophan transporter [Pseudalkalibacillus caeni]